MSPVSLLTLRAFLSSPGDVADERHLAREVLRNLEQEYAFRSRVKIEVVAWDDPAAPAALPTHLTPQAGINESRPKPSDCDVAVVVLWSRMGTPLPGDFRKPDGAAYRSGTKWEFLDALAGAERNRGRPVVWVYRRTEKIRFDADDPDLDAKRAQWQGVKSFFAGFEDEIGALRRSYHAYPSPSAFEALLEKAPPRTDQHPSGKPVARSGSSSGEP